MRDYIITLRVESMDAPHDGASTTARVRAATASIVTVAFEKALAKLPPGFTPQIYEGD